MIIVRLNILTVAIAASYVTLGIFDPTRAQELWAFYAGLTFVLALITLTLDDPGHE